MRTNFKINFFPKLKKKRLESGRPRAEALRVSVGCPCVRHTCFKRGEVIGGECRGSRRGKVWEKEV